MNPPPAASRQLAELVPLPALKSAADALEMQARQWDSLIGRAACASVHTHVAAHGYGLPDGAPALCEPPDRNYRPAEPESSRWRPAVSSEVIRPTLGVQAEAGHAGGVCQAHQRCLTNQADGIGELEPWPGESTPSAPDDPAGHRRTGTGRNN